VPARSPGTDVFVAIRSIKASPFGDARLDYGGYDSNFQPAEGAAVGSDLPRGVRSTSDDRRGTVLPFVPPGVLSLCGFKRDSVATIRRWPDSSVGDRTTTHRSYTVFIDFGSRPKDPAPNTLNTGDGQNGTPNVHGSFIYRIYVPASSASGRGPHELDDWTSQHTWIAAFRDLRRDVTPLVGMRGRRGRVGGLGGSREGRA
jgi:hypothetical protein